MNIENPNLEGFITMCPIRTILDRLGDRWTILVLVQLQKGMRRFSVLRREIPDISPRMLSLTVRRLEEDGLISREVFPTIPPRVEYTITPLGKSFVDALNGLVYWAADNREAVLAARQAYVPPTAEPIK